MPERILPLAEIFLPFGYLCRVYFHQKIKVRELREGEDRGGGGGGGERGRGEKNNLSIREGPW